MGEDASEKRRSSVGTKPRQREASTLVIRVDDARADRRGSWTPALSDRRLSPSPRGEISSSKRRIGKRARRFGRSAGGSARHRGESGRRAKATRRCTYRNRASSTCPRCPSYGPRRRRRRTRRATCRGRRYEGDRATSSAIGNRDRGGAASASGPCLGRASRRGRPRARRCARGWASGGGLRHRSSFFR